MVGSYHLDLWEDQEYRPEVWIEKEALIGVFEGVCQEYDVPYFACRGYCSQSEMWAAGQRLLSYKRKNMEPVILHFGDHDPSGIDMTRDIRDRLQLFVGMKVKVERIALTMEQVRRHNPPPNPAKLTDVRANDYIRAYGHQSWELDALDPPTLVQLVRTNVLLYRDEGLYQQRFAQQTTDVDNLQTLSDEWEDVRTFLEAADGDQEDRRA